MRSEDRVELEEQIKIEYRVGQGGRDRGEHGGLCHLRCGVSSRRASAGEGEREAEDVPRPHFGKVVDKALQESALL